MRSGSLRHRITIQQLTTAQDSYGEEVETWALLAEVWAEFMPTTSREFYAEHQLNSEMTAMIKIRYRSDVNEKNRILFNGSTFEIIGQPINPEMRNRELHIKAKELL